jgi:DNA-binding MarR family transcriptional regulator
MTQQHYRLTLEEAIALHKCGLISATALLYLFLRIRLAPGWKMTLHQREITEKLGIGKYQFYRAIERLRKKGLIDWEAPNGVVVALKVTEAVEQDCNSLNKTATVEQDCNSIEQNRNSLNKTATPLDKTATNTPAKPASVKASSASSDSYQIFIKSLSDTAREKFFNFVREKVKNFKTPIHDKEAWLAGSNGAGKERFRVYYAMFQAEVGSSAAQDWENHPQRDEWIAQIRQGKGRFVAQGGPRSEWEMRKVFAEWAIANNLVWGNKP